MGPLRLQGTEKEWTRADMPSSSFTIEEEESSPSPSEASTSGSGGPYIEHTVSRLDTLAGVAIKYGVEVIKCLLLCEELLVLVCRHCVVCCVCSRSHCCYLMVI